MHVGGIKVNDASGRPRTILVVFSHTTHEERDAS